MFKQQMSQDDDPKTVLSLGIGEIRRPSESLRNSTRNKRQRSPDCPRLIIGIGSSSSAVNPTYGGECYYRDEPRPNLDLFHRNTAPGSYQQYVDGLCSDDINRIHVPGGNRRADICDDIAYSRAATPFSDAPQSIQHRKIENHESAKRQAIEAQEEVNTELKSENDVLKKIVRYLLAILRKNYTRVPSLSRSYSAPL